MTAANTPRVVAFVDETMYVEGKGYRVSLVVEGEAGHRPTGVWPNDGTEVMPWFWGPTIKDAKRAARDYNEQRGISKEDEFGIIARSMSAGSLLGKGRSNR